MFEKVKLSAVKVISINQYKIKGKFLTTKDQETQSDQGNGSGAIIQQVEGGTFILTAGHVCVAPNQNERVLFHFPYYIPELYDLYVEHKYLIIDNFEKAHVAIMVANSPLTDICILLSTKINLNELKLSDNEPRPSEKVYSINFPKGIFSKNFNPILDGRFIGPIVVNDKTESNGFSMPSYPGSSGGLIVNLDGELIGMVHSHVKEFHHITFGAKLQQIKDIIENSNFIFDLLHEPMLIDLNTEDKYFSDSMKSTK